MQSFQQKTKEIVVLQGFIQLGSLIFLHEWL